MYEFSIMTMFIPPGGLRAELGAGQVVGLAPLYVCYYNMHYVGICHNVLLTIVVHHILCDC